MKPIIVSALLVLASQAGFSQLKPDPINALNHPSKHAWDLFLTVNHPAQDPQKGRGIPDTSKRVGDDGMTVWETWKSAGSEVFLEDGSKPEPWDDQSTKRAPIRAKRFDVPKSKILDAIHRGMSIQDALSPKKLLNVEEDGVFQQGGGETRMNKSTFDFIVNNGLYNVNGQERLYTEVVASQRKPLSFPIDSIEVKAMWILLSADDLKPDGKGSHYHQGKDSNGRTYGLVALHVITKDTPNWFWCSFRQIEGPNPQIPSVDNYGRPSVLNGTKWQYYELSGTQTDFVDSFGRPTLLSDPHIEAGFERSSCISCHALASIGAPSDLPTGDRLRFFNLPAGDTPLGDGGTPIGIPRSSFFFDANGAQKYIALDFLYSLHFRARRAQQP